MLLRNDIDCLTIDNSVSACKSDSPITDLGLFLTTSCLSAGLEATYSRCLLGLLLLSWSSLLPKWVFHVLAPRELMEDLQTNISVESGYSCAGNLCANTKSHELCALAGCRPITSWRSRPSGTGGPALKPACAAVRFCHAGAILAGPGCVQAHQGWEEVADCTARPALARAGANDKYTCRKEEPELGYALLRAGLPAFSALTPPLGNVMSYVPDMNCT